MTQAACGRPIRGMVQAPTERSRDFKGSAIRLVKRLTPQRGLTAAVILLGVGGIAIGVSVRASSAMPPTCCSTA